jgi:hypothetical protein
MSGLHRQKTLPHAQPFEPSRAAKLELSNAEQERWIDYEPVRLDADTICRALSCHKSFKLQAGCVINDLPKFGDFTAYGNLSEEDELGLCEAEVRRLVRSANSDETVQLQGGDDMFGPATQDGYLRLHQLGRMLIQSFLICQHDVALVQAENMDSDPDYKLCARLQARLLSDFDLVPCGCQNRCAAARAPAGHHHAPVHEAHRRCHRAVLDGLGRLLR